MRLPFFVAHLLDDRKPTINLGSAAEVAEEAPVLPGVYRDPNIRTAEELIELRARVGRLEVDVRRLAEAIDRLTQDGGDAR